ncbi:MAG TPA: hypothetical protein VLA97_09670 [Nocardioidaceae bacterium]|nr:hypothetical protein [Nocardioidaceae bacterium]
MKKLLPFGTLGLAGLVGIGLMSLPTSTVAANLGDETVTKRDDSVTELVLVDDDDNDDTNGTGTQTRTRSRNTGLSRSTNDNTRSNFTKVSRDRDQSRSDKTKDWTRDGGSRTRDWSADKTNDRSRNDTRGRR